MRILLVDDEAELRAAIARRLRALGHAVDEAADGAAMDCLLAMHEPAVMVLDRMLPDGDALARLQRWRRCGRRTPVLLLTARTQVADRVAGLTAGADDYLVKPFAMEELLARVAALGRRDAPPRAIVLRAGTIELDSGRREVRRAGVLIPLRPKEFALLELLLARAGQVVSRAEIIESCWDNHHEPASNVDEAVIAALRRKLGQPDPIRTVRGAGYQLVPSEDGA